MIGVIVNGQSYPLNNANYGYVITTDGFGMPPIERYSQRGAQQHGDSDIGYRLTPRRIMLVVALPTETESAYYLARGRMLKIFHPDNLITIYVNDENGFERRLDCIFEHSMQMPMEKDWRAANVAINLKTSGLPAWYDPAAQAARIDGGGGGNAFSVPMPVPHNVGAVDINATETIYYAGTWQEYPRIRIAGPITNPVIRNTETDEKLDFTGYTLPSGHYIEIDTAYGKKTVVYDGVTNYIDKLTADSDLATFHLVPTDPGEDFHENAFQVTGTSVTGNTEIQIFYNDRFIGI